MRHRGTNHLPSAVTGIVLALLLVGNGLAQGTFAGHIRHRDVGNIHMLYQGGSSTYFGVAGFTSIQDLDGDRHPEILVGDSVNDVLTVISGRVGNRWISQVKSKLGSDAFGFSVATIGDLDGDKIDDFAVGAPNATLNKMTKVGQVHVFSGKISGGTHALLTSFSGGTANGQFGFSVVGPGDVDGDGVDDIAIAEPGDATNAPGVVHVFSGNAKHPSGAYSLIFKKAGRQVGERYGEALGAAGDINADGRPDVIVGAPYWNGANATMNGRAEVLIWSGTTNPVLTVISAGSGQSGDNHGFSVSGLGTIAGAPRVLVGAPGHSSKFAAGGRLQMLAPAHPWIAPVEFFGDSASDQLGYSVAEAGDVNRDGVPDLAVSAPTDDPFSGVRDSGTVYFLSYDDTKKAFSVLRTRQRSDNGGCGKDGLRLGVRIVAAHDIDQDDYKDLLIGSNWRTRSGVFCDRWADAQRRIYVDSPIDQYLYADRANLDMNQVSPTVAFECDAGASFANQFLLVLGSGPHNANPPPSCGLSLGSSCIPVNPTSVWFGFALSGAPHPVVALLDAQGTASFSMSLGRHQGPPLPLKIYTVGVLLKLPGPLTPTLVTNSLPVWLR